MAKTQFPIIVETRHGFQLCEKSSDTPRGASFFVRATRVSQEYWENWQKLAADGLDYKQIQTQLSTQ